MSKKKKKSSDEEAGGSFMMMFVTLSLILLAFFILLNSLAVIDAKKKRQAMGSLLGSFGIMPGSDSPDQSDEQSIKTAKLFSGEGMNQFFKELQREIDLIQSQGEIPEDQAQVTFDKSTGEIKILLSEQLLFPAGEAVISLVLFPLLDKTAQIARQTGGRMVVTGHTDNRKNRGRSNNWELSLKRGVIVARHLEAVGPIRKGQVLASGMSHYEPLKANDSAEGRAANRRVEIQIRTKDVDY
jgi:chemotaxis protein MotB